VSISSPDHQRVTLRTCVNFRQLAILSEMQAGLLVSISFPDHCDALALFNAVYAVATA